MFETAAILKSLHRNLAPTAAALLCLSAGAVQAQENCERTDPSTGAPACWPSPSMDDQAYGKVLVDRLEMAFGDDAGTYAWDAEAWYGDDYNKVWFKTEGEGLRDGGLEEAEVQVLYSRLISPYFDLQAGVRYDIRPEPGRAYAVLGLQGMAPYLFEVDTALFVSEDGDASLRGEFEYEFMFTQKVVLSPRLELSFAAQDVPEFGIGSGLSSLEAGLRLRYEIRPEFAPYIGLGFERKYGDTADFARAAGEPAETFRFVIGIRAWF